MPLLTVRSKFEDRTGVLVSLRAERVHARIPLWDWWLGHVAESLAQTSGSHLEHDLERYLELCDAKPLSRAELEGFLSQYGRLVFDRDIPHDLSSVSSALLCRDDAAIKIAIWASEETYWEIRWSVPSS
jgi:hypothetical protein